MALRSSTGWWTRMSSYLRVSLSDVVVGLAYLVVAESVLLMTPDGGAARVVVGIPLLLFVPGYALVATLFPGRGEAVTERQRRLHLPTGTEGGVDAVERMALAFGLSVTVVPLVAFALSLAGVGFSLAALVTALVLFSAVGLLAAGVRRHRLPAEERFDPSFATAFGRTKRAVFDAPGPFQTSLTVALVGSIVLLSLVFGVALFSPAAGTPNTNMLLLTENETGSYVAGGYPTDLSTGETAELVVGVQNNERERVDYTVVVQLQRVSTDGEDVTVRERREVTRLTESVPAGETWYAEHGVTPETADDRTRLTYLLYRGEPPADPSVESSYQHTYLWLNVSA